MPFWLFCAYGFLLITHFFSGIVYNYGDLYRILPYFIVCLFLVYSGHEVGRTFRIQSIGKVLNVKLRTIGYLSVFGSVIYIYDIFRMNSISFGSRIEDLSISPLGVIGNAMSGLSLLVWLYSLYFYKIEKIKISAIAYLSVMAYVAGGVLSAGRQAVIILVISSVILLIWSSKKNKENLKNASVMEVKKSPKPWGVYVLVSLFISYFLFISEVRSGLSNIFDKITVYEQGYNATTSERTLNLANNLGGFTDIYLESCYYYSHELIRLDLLYQYYDYPPLFGLSQMSYLERRFQWLVGKQGDISWDKQVFALEEKGRFSSHTWSTFIGNFIVDFGRVGTLFACFFMGLIIGIIYRRFKVCESPKRIIRLCIICTGTVFSIQFSPISELIYFTPLLFCSFLVLQPE
ncbi:hypothetical protein ACHRVK_12700 [Flavobacterium plurextorum]|uniref:hypothetical protein n=1 Tax=Flavobacterium plurextorum TaxID=1114867 RepID=UPI00375810B9